MTIELFKMFPARKVDDYQDWYHFIEINFEIINKSFEFNFDIFPYKGNENRPSNFHIRYTFEINFNKGFIYSFISWQ